MKTDILMKKKQVELNKTEFEYPNMTRLMSFSSVSGFHDHESGQDSNEQKEIEEFKSNNPTQKKLFWWRPWRNKSSQLFCRTTKINVEMRL